MVYKHYETNIDEHNTSASEDERLFNKLYKIVFNTEAVSTLSEGNLKVFLLK